MSKVNINSAIKGYSSHSYNPISVGSIDFGQLVPNRVIECVKGDKFSSIKGSGFLRLAPTIFPAYGRVKINTAAFFVPESQLIQQSDAFHSNMSTYKGRSVVLPSFYAYSVNELFVNHSRVVDSTHPFKIDDYTYLAYRIGDTTIPSYDSTSDVFDFSFPYQSSGAGPIGHYRLTTPGRHMYKVLKSLGYDFCSFPDVASYTKAEQLIYCNFKVNALPLLAYLKIYVDMFLNPHFYNSDLLVNALKCIHDCEDYTGTSPYTTATYTASTGLLSSDFLYFALSVCNVPYSRNMYLDAWNSPNSPDGVQVGMVQNTEVSDGLISPIIPDTPSGSYFEHVIANGVNSVVEQNNNASGSITNIRYLSQYGLNWIESFFKFVRRNNLFGSKAIERLFARFGIKSSDFNSKFVNKIFEGSDDIDFSAVLSQTDSYVDSTGEGKTLGSYAGYGAAGLNFEFSHKCDSFGYIIILNWISIIPLKPTGFNPHVLRLSPLDFYTPEWDGKTLRAIPMCEIGRSDAPYFSGNLDKQVFGFTDIYDDYRELQDNVFGDFVLDENVKDFVFSRDLGYYRRFSSAIKPQSSIQYYSARSMGDTSNPFQFLEDIADRFYLQFNYKISSQRPILSKSSALDLTGEGDIDMKLGGSQLS